MQGSKITQAGGHSEKMNHYTRACFENDWLKKLLYSLKQPGINSQHVLALRKCRLPICLPNNQTQAPYLKLVAALHQKPYEPDVVNKLPCLFRN